jgi:uncharacterized membrane protein YfcA
VLSKVCRIGAWSQVPELTLLTNRVNGRGYDWARLVFTALFALTTLSMIGALAHHAAVYARADLIAGIVLWLVALAAVVLIFSRKSNPYYRQEPAQR